MENAAKIGNAEASIRLADYYGYATENEHNEMWRWIKLAAKQGHPTAQNMLGAEAYKHHDLNQAIDWYLKTAKQGEADGCLEDCLFLKQTEDTLPIFIQKGKQGDSRASYRVAKYFAYSENVAHPGLSKQSLTWLKLAANQGSGKAQNDLGWYYESSDEEKAIYWYKKAAGQVIPEAKTRLDNLNSPINNFKRFFQFPVSNKK